MAMGSADGVAVTSAAFVDLDLSLDEFDSDSGFDLADDDFCDAYYAFVVSANTNISGAAGSRVRPSRPAAAATAAAGRARRTPTSRTGRWRRTRTWQRT
ncbi:hypothetical protein ACP70R_015795 [Stipagrostis hirtigluma subsp. patula]